MFNPMDLSGKHILVTGASRGIGRAVCVLASKLGAKVSMAARNEEGLKETLSMMEGEGHGLFSCDLTEETSVEELVKNCVAQNGKLDGMVHCAGITFGVPIKMNTWDKARQIMDINFYAFVTLIRLAGAKKYGNDGASLIGISSASALHGQKSQVLYAATKASIMGVTAPAAKELAARKIRVNNVVFSMVRTDMYELFQKDGGDSGHLFERQYLGIIEPEDAANSICFLLSDASRMITGTSLVVDGGFLS